MVTIEIGYEGELHCRAIHGPSKAQIETDAPVDNHGRGEAFSPTDLCASSLGVCMLTILGIAARGRGVDLQGATGMVTKEMSADLPRRIAKIGVLLRIPLPPDHPHRAALEAAANACPVHHSLHPDIEREVTWEWVG